MRKTVFLLTLIFAIIISQVSMVSEAEAAETSSNLVFVGTFTGKSKYDVYIVKSSISNDIDGWINRGDKYLDHFTVAVRVDVDGKVDKTSDGKYFRAQTWEYSKLKKDNCWYLEGYFHHTNIELQARMNINLTKQGNDIGVAVFNTVQKYRKKPSMEEIQRQIDVELNKRKQAKADKLQKETQQENASADYVKQGDAKFKAKDYVTAKNLFLKAIEVNPNSHHSHYMLAKCYLKDKNKDYDLILKEIDKALKTCTANQHKEDARVYWSNLADYYDLEASVYQKLALKNMFNANNKVNYVVLANQCKVKSAKLRDRVKNGMNANNAVL